ncbi:hypothetical protein PR048_027850 [Dryococelus australis]|uniref:Uncharacterized protein n=1 Tax=Dryococelus australis TaxID=614101 RepID=A0ABQ9GHM4_9NEOP|nr:hypothetical protein PR048_027850 [Dryococelus australis]
MEQRRNEMTGKREIPEQTRRAAASSGTIPTCEDPGVTRPFTLVGGEQSNRLATVAPLSSWKILHLAYVFTSQDYVAMVDPGIDNTLRVTGFCSWDPLVPVIPEHDMKCGPRMELCWNVRAGETGVPRENPPARGIVQHYSHTRKSGSEPSGDCTRIAVVGGECATAAPKGDD